MPRSLGCPQLVGRRLSVVCKVVKSGRGLRYGNNYQNRLTILSDASANSRRSGARRSRQRSMKLAAATPQIIGDQVSALGTPEWGRLVAASKRALKTMARRGKFSEETEIENQLRTRLSPRPAREIAATLSVRSASGSVPPWIRSCCTVT
jgi:hypothetical protein